VTRIIPVPAQWAHPRGADGRYIPQDPPPAEGDVAWVAYADGLPVSARCATRRAVDAWLEVNVASGELVDASGLADPPPRPPPPEPTLWDRLRPLLGSQPQPARMLATALGESTPRVVQALHAHRHLVQASGRRGRRAYALRGGA